MPNVLSWIWTQFTVTIANINNHYIKSVYFKKKVTDRNCAEENRKNDLLDISIKQFQKFISEQF